LFERSFSKEDLDKAAYILGIKIYRDRSRCPMILSKNAHLDMILKEFKIDQQRRSSLKRKDLSKSYLHIEHQDLLR